MKAADVMTPNPLSVRPDAAVSEALRLMLQRGFGGLPVTGEDGAVVGILTEGDLSRRARTGTRPQLRWVEFLVGRRAGERARTGARKVAEVMTRDIVTVGEDTSLEEIVQLMELHRIKRLPVVREGMLVGIVSRANLLRALASLARETRPTSVDDTSIRQRLVAELSRQPGRSSCFVNVVVRNGVVHLWGTILDERQRRGIRVAAENTAGVNAVEDHLVWVDPSSSLTMVAENEARQGAR